MPNKLKHFSLKDNEKFMPGLMMIHRDCLSLLHMFQQYATTVCIANIINCSSRSYMYSQLLRCITARESCAGFSCVVYFDQEKHACACVHMVENNEKRHNMNRMKCYQTTN